MELLNELYSHPAYKNEDIEILRKRVEVSEVLQELKELIGEYSPTVKVINVLGKEHYNECWESRRQLGIAYDMCGIRCLCLQLRYLRRKAENLLNDIEKLSGNKKHKGLFTSLSRCCGSVEERY
jgi:hypothetical protein